MKGQNDTRQALNKTFERLHQKLTQRDFFVSGTNAHKSWSYKYTYCYKETVTLVTLTAHLSALYFSGLKQANG